MLPAQVTATCNCKPRAASADEVRGSNNSIKGSEAWKAPPAWPSRPHETRRESCAPPTLRAEKLTPRKTKMAPSSRLLRRGGRGQTPHVTSPSGCAPPPRCPGRAPGVPRPRRSCPTVLGAFFLVLARP